MRILHIMKKSIIILGFLFLLLVVLATFPYSSNGRTAGTEETMPETVITLEDLYHRIEALLDEYEIPGAGIAIVAKDSIICVEGLGFAHFESKTPVDGNSHFRAGSIAKSFVALGILKLVEEGKVDLQDPVHEILPELGIENRWRETDPVRIVHLLEHTAGFNDTHFNDFYLDGDPEIPLIDGLRVSENCLKVRWQPGAWKSYSSVGFAVAGCVIEKIAEMKFEDYLTEEILRPLDMPTSTFKLTPESKALLAQGYESNYKTTPYWFSYTRPAGEFNTSAGEMALYLQFMLNGGRVGESQIYNKASLKRMESSTTDPAIRAGLKPSSGLGIGIEDYSGFQFFSHYGSTAGFAGCYTYCREIDRGCVLLTNRYDADFVAGISAIWEEMTKFLVQGAAGKEKSFPPIPEIPAQELENFSGWYQLRNPQQQLIAFLDMITNYIEIKVEGDTLVLGDPFFGGNWEHLIPVTANTFRLEGETRASKAFFVTREGKQAFIRGRSGYEKMPSWRPWADRILFMFSWLVMFSTILYAIVWIPVDLSKRITKRDDRSTYLRIRILPLTAVIIFTIAIILVSTQPLMDYGQRTPQNIFLFIATWLFAILSVCSLFFSILSFRKPVRLVACVYALVVSACLVGLTLYLGYWGIIGLKLWAY